MLNNFIFLIILTRISGLEFSDMGGVTQNGGGVFLKWYELCQGIYIHNSPNFLIIAHPSLKLERPTLTMHILWCKTDICSWKLSAKVSLMLDNPFPVPFLDKMKNISVYFHYFYEQHENHLQRADSLQRKLCFLK